MKDTIYYWSLHKFSSMYNSVRAHYTDHWEDARCGGETICVWCGMMPPIFIPVAIPKLIIYNIKYIERSFIFHACLTPYNHYTTRIYCIYTERIYTRSIIIFSCFAVITHYYFYHNTNRYKAGCFPIEPSSKTNIGLHWFSHRCLTSFLHHRHEIRKETEDIEPMKSLTSDRYSQIKSWTVL